MSETAKEQAVKQMDHLLRNCCEEVYGFFYNHTQGTAIVIGEKLAPERRLDIQRMLSAFSNVFFLSGLSRKGCREDPNLIQRVLMYGGTIPGWEWARGTGDWQKFFSDC